MESFSLKKKIENISDQPELVDMVNKSLISLKKQNFDIDNHIAKVAICIDLSGSMHQLLRSGSVSEIIKRALAQGIIFDDDGEIDVFGFGNDAKYFGTTNAKEFASFAESFRKTETLGITNYAKAIDLISNHYEDDGFDYPSYVIFVTDGDASDKPEARNAIKRVSKMPIFFQFVAIGLCDYDPNEKKEEKKEEKPKGFLSRLFSGSSEETDSSDKNFQLVQSRFGFLLELDDMKGRFIDNAGFFAVKEPNKMKPERMFELLNTEYPEWYKEAKSRKMFTK